MHTQRLSQLGQRVMSKDVFLACGREGCLSGAERRVIPSEWFEKKDRAQKSKVKGAKAHDSPEDRISALVLDLPPIEPESPKETRVQLLSRRELNSRKCDGNHVLSTVVH